MEHLITISHVYKLYNAEETRVEALIDVSLEIDPGEFVAIIGRSGSGKSTLMNILGCLDTPTEGTYYLNGKDVSGLNANELAEIRNQEIGFVFQGFNLISGLDAIENVELPLIYRGMPRAERRKLAEDALEKVGLGERVHHQPNQMSGGQQQRVAIARAIAARPPILLADEPTGNLDSRSGAAVMEILHSLHKKGKTIILITHDEKIAQSAQRIVQIQDGRLSQ